MPRQIFSLVRLPLGLALALWSFLNITCRAQVPLAAWPALPQTGFLVGRSASRNDVSAGSAAFVLEKDGVAVGNPIKVAIPQYAYHLEGSNHARVACVIIQAEEFRGVQLYGYRSVQGNKVAVDVGSSFILLGANKK
jgi:hypothetical protein